MTRLLTVTLTSMLFAAPAMAQTTFDCPETCEDVVWGDANGDGDIDIADLIVVTGAFNGDFIPCRGADINGDGQFDIADVIYLTNYLYNGGPPPVQQWCCDQCESLRDGDVNQDGKVNIADAIAITAYINGQLKADDICLAAADINGDGIIDDADTKLLLDYLFHDGKPPSAIECLEE